MNPKSSRAEYSIKMLVFFFLGDSDTDSSLELLKLEHCNLWKSWNRILVFFQIVSFYLVPRSQN